MNPYLEQTSIWADFHIEFLTKLRRLLAPQVGPRYFVQIEQHIFLRDRTPQPRLDVEKVRYLKVLDCEGRELVTIIEMLSPWNKRAGEASESYLAERRELLRSPAHLVEIDLLRG